MYAWYDWNVEPIEPVMQDLGWDDWTVWSCDCLQINSYDVISSCDYKRRYIYEDFGYSSSFCWIS